MYKRFKDIKTIVFPVFKLRSADWYEQDGVLFDDRGAVLDDKNMPGSTLGVRRIQCGRTDLAKLRGAYPDFPSMLQSKKKIFIDNAGVPFIYEKTINTPLIHHSIRKIELKEELTLIWFHVVPFPVQVPRPPYGEPRWGRILYYKGSPWILYDLTAHRGKDSFKRV
jgi:hypothetical protein